MRPCYFDIDQARNRRAASIVAFERAARGGGPPLPQPRRTLRGGFAAVVARLREWRRRARGREQLSRLDARLLRDIGITPFDAARECDKPFWRP